MTAGPTHEPIDAVRYIANRSSGRVGTLLAREAARRGHAVTLLLGPVACSAPLEGVVVQRFRTCEDLRALLSAHAHEARVIVMAAAVADFRPSGDRSTLGKIKRRPGESLTLELESTPDLIAEVASRRRPGQFIVAFALETAGEVLASARTKLDRKRVDLVVGNPLDTMDAQTIEAVVVDRSGIAGQTPGVIGKEAFAAWLLDLIESRLAGQSP
ncbi:MAG: phosphopantothenoylcysteine decarboxylase [Phycisphaeraceae bacterium]|nr:phosphopantothenoylcysteine decarboxylase [Phycisphaerae bacterium]MBX3391309.1 phosphopantothenoylcysteine decarboxylase [Phycisphaeraceae bacterium]